ncbi:hypothetical protein A2276_05800 [candidate division WOR-1 bacterium RIFOXYA12_FULL_43_27]|uniref:Undecaprenyl-phosphate alpha-N-acetylglucosaminyl 1-phosphate transferase n=1 Tax=candidate division WOR-1 bacterium RIFOXYC2_FULL_46_14 TaxID=1802587 RepID=A0A1F4U3N6_UNCSA|nr:MAG: hypothetical protein A2276_05800 [candidate division WOR-1 bacterium RIFOXYA12_FULL_43_27]OGC20175.1 MAG: hypothetical protein A2292_03800 [candidate division WOR-1 bacterium RIFOXYB2_FULL_46_45]OGC32087.1 MAG: hypothetical protein A2232_07645 [candidate division WOR-1 bacterium RIFOXYA2_FULL_46_56]OGC39489.1 MAG: hypothetical protein A2438_08010 [candidate division WOR-1 bacterium RIFOXYC2_FULL_46_14]
MEQLICFFIALILSLSLTPLAKLLARRINVLDHPNHRKIHDKPIPLMGGMAIFLSSSLSLLFFAPKTPELLWILFFGLIFILFGFLDDAGIKIRARIKIWSHLVFALLFVHLTGIGVFLFPWWWFNLILSACFITFMTNSFNMLDGMDGLVSGVAFFAGLSFFVLGLSNNLSDVAILSIALAGACLGFLKYNFNPASIFLGEEGSTFIGFILATIAMKLKIFSLWNIALVLNIPRLQFVSFIVPLIILGIPIFDTFFVFSNRLLHNLKMSTPGKDHSHHRIHLMGLSQKMTVLTLYAVQIVLGAIALSMVTASLVQFFSLIIIVITLAVFACVFLLRVKVYT